MGVYNNNKDGTRSTLANTIQVVDAPMEQFVSRGEFSAVTPNDVSADNKLVAENEVTKTYDTMPTASELIVMSDNTVFETKGFYEKGDGAGGKYLIASTYTTNSKRVSSGGVTKYLLVLTDDGAITDVIDVVKFGLRPYRGDLSGTLNPTNTYATANSAIMSALTTFNSGVTLRFGFGRFVFANPLVLTSTRINLKGVETPMSIAQTDANYANGTVLAFPFLTNGQIAIDAIGGNIEDIMVYGSYSTYSITFDRTKTITAPNEVITETIAQDSGTDIKCTGIHRIAGGHMRNVSVAGFYTGIELETANWYLDDIYCQKCHFGLVINRDTKCMGVYGKDVHTLATIKGSVSSIQQLRVDSCVHAVNVYGGHCVTLDDIDGDYCTDSLILLGNIEDHKGELYNASFTNIHGRCCTLKAYAKADYPNGLDVRTLASTAGYGVISLDTNTKIYRSYFQLNSNGGREPVDGNTTHECPHIVLTFPNAIATRVKDCIFSFPSDDIKTPDDVLKYFENTNGTPTYKVDTSNNTYYVEGSNVRVASDRRYNVLDYGLKGDRTTDNTTALRSLISLIPNGSVIFFPVGTYMITEGIEINKDVTFLGENEEMQTAGTAPNRLHDPMSIIKYGGNTANVTMFAKASTGYNDVNFINLTFDGGGSYTVEDNGANTGEWTGTKEPAQYTLATVKSGSNPNALGLYEYDTQTETYSLTEDTTIVSGKDYYLHLPFHNQLETVVLQGINGLDLQILAPGIVKNCMFWGFSGYGLRTAQHKYVERCGFYMCKKGIVTTWSDNLLHDLWFCKSGTAIYMQPLTGDTNHFVSINVSDIWADQLIDHLIEADSTVTSAQIIASNIWVDSVGKSAFYLPNAVVSRSNIQGTFGRIGLDYAGIPDACRTSALAQYTDFMACGRIVYSILELNISNTTVGKGWNANGECFSRLITTYKPYVSNDHNKVTCNAFPVARLYDLNTQPQYGYFVDTEYNGTDGNVLIYLGSTYVNGFFTYTNSPVGRCKAPSKDFLVYDRLAKKLYRSTASDDNTAWVEVKIEGDIPHYSTMPSTADLFALPNNTVFETDGYWERIDGNGGKYLITTNYTSGALKLVNDGSTRYLVALNAVGAYERYIINPCRYGVRAIKGVAFENLTLANSFAEENSAVFTNLVAPEMRSIYKFPAGEYVFKDPINLKGRQKGLKGEGCPNPTNGFTASSTADYTNTGTTLIFPFLNDGDIAIDTALSSISDIAIFGSVNSYDISIDRTKTITAPNEVVTETAVVQCTGIKAQGVNVSNVFVACFYKGIDGVGSNNYFNNIFLYKCHTGIHLGGDNKAIGVYAWLTHTCAEIQGSLISLIQLRVDSCVNAMRIIGGKACTFEDIDGDYCTGSLIEVGDGTTWGDVIGCSFSNIHGRACALNSYDMTQDPDGIDVRDIPQSNNGGYGAIHVNIRITFSNNSFIFNSKFGGSNPFDSTSNYRTPDIGFTFENTTGLGTISENTFRYNASISSNEDLLKKIQVRNSNDYTLRVDAFNSTYYIEGTTAQEDNPSTDINFTTLLGGE